MTKIDNSFMEKLEEVLYDEKKAINYKMVSIMFGVHVNIAKQMLYHFYTTKKTEAKKIHAMYYLSGMVTWKTLSSMSSSMGSWEGEESKKKVPESESYLVLLCKDTDLEEYKSKFSRLFSVHVYSLSSFALENYDVLERLVEEPLVDSEGRTPLDFGPIVCSESEKLLEGIPIVETKAKVAPVPIKETVKKAEKETSSANSKGSQESISKAGVAEVTKKSSGQKAVIAPPGEKNGANRLKNMFATAAAKPKPKVDKVEIKTEPKAKEVPKPSTKTSSKSKSESNGKSRNSETRKRKRIRDVLSSSESEDEKKSDDEDDCLPESPVPPRKRIQIESDSDDDDFKEAPKSGKDKVKDEVSKASTTDNKPTAPGRRRVFKTVSDTRMSDDGFMVTEKKQVMVSEDEDAEEETKKSNPTSSNSKPASVPEAKKADPKPAKPASSSKPSSGKTKQPSLMSFFQKK